MSLQFRFFSQDIMVLAFPLPSSQGMGPRISTEGKSKAIPSAEIDPVKPEIFALEVNNGPVSLMRDCAIYEFGILNPRVKLLLVMISLFFFEGGIQMLGVQAKILELLFWNSPLVNY